MPDYETSKISFTIDDRLYKGLNKRALAAGSTANLYAKDLCVAAFSSRVKPPTGDNDLDDAVYRMFAEGQIRNGAEAASSNAKGDDALRSQIRKLSDDLVKTIAEADNKNSRVLALEEELKRSGSAHAVMANKVSAANREKEALTIEAGALKEKITALEQAVISAPVSVSYPDRQQLLDRNKDLERRNSVMSGKLGNAVAVKTRLEKELEKLRVEIEEMSRVGGGSDAALREEISKQQAHHEQETGNLRADLAVANAEVERLRGLCLPKTVMVQAPADGWLKPMEAIAGEFETIAHGDAADKTIPLEFYGLKPTAVETDLIPSFQQDDRKRTVELERVLASNVAEIARLHAELDAASAPAPVSNRLITAIVVSWGNGLNTADIAEKTNLSEATIDRIISAWKAAEHERKERQ